MAKYAGVSISVIRRLPRYYRYLGELKDKGVERISSRRFAEIIGVTASQIRQDLNCFGGFGQQGYGYNVATLHYEIGKILSLDKKLPAVLLGAGNLGQAIAKHMRFHERGFNLLGVFDHDPNLIGKKILDWNILDTSDLDDFCMKHQPLVAILCVTENAAPEVAEKLVGLGITGFWNFTHYDLGMVYGDKIVVENVHLSDSLMTLSFNVNEHLN